MKVLTLNTETQKVTEKELNGFLTPLDYIKLNFCYWGLYEVQKESKTQFKVYCKFTKKLLYNILFTK